MGLQTWLRCRNPKPMTTLLLSPPLLAAAGWDFLTYFLGGGFGLALVVFVVLKTILK